MNTLSIVIPAYNEEDGIAEIIERVLPIRPGLKGVGVDDLELIVVDDGSHDRTAEIAGCYPDVRLLQHTVNQGYGAALKTGFGRASGNLLGFLDADGTYPPEHFPDLCRVALTQEADLVIGSRMAGAESEMPLVRRIGNWLFANLVSLLGSRRVTDSSSGMRVIRREALSRLYPLPDGLNFTPVMSTRALHEEIHWVEVPIPYKERLGRSKLNPVTDGVRFLNTIVWTALNYNPARILGGVGLALALLAAAIAVALFVARLSGVDRLGSWGVGGVYLGAVSAYAGLTLFSLGVTFNYLVSLFHECTVRQGLFGNKPLFKRPLERNFGWIGLLALLAGLALGVASIVLSLAGWPIYRVWFWLLAAALSAILGLQLLVFWVIIQVLGELSQREADVARDLEGKACQ
jgi:glycosyltransferase involved in cell wall biosynthesis